MFQEILIIKKLFHALSKVRITIADIENAFYLSGRLMCYTELMRMAYRR